MRQKHEAQICIAGALVGAAVGAAVAYLYATDTGADRRARFSRTVDRLTVDADDAQQLWVRLNDAWTQFERARARSISRATATRTWPPEGAA